VWCRCPCMMRFVQSYARAHTHAYPQTCACVRTLAARPSRQSILGGDCPCRLCPVRNVWRCAPFLTISGSVLLSDVPPPLREAQTPASAGRRPRIGARVRCLAPNMGRTIVGNGDVGRGDPGAIGGRREKREQPRRPLPPGVLTGFSGRVRASLQRRRLR